MKTIRYAGQLEDESLGFFADPVDDDPDYGPRRETDFDLDADLDCDGDSTDTDAQPKTSYPEEW